MSKNYIIINEKHKLTQEQIEILDNTFQSYEIYKVPEERLNLDMLEKTNLPDDANIIFVSQVQGSPSALYFYNYKMKKI